MRVSFAVALAAIAGSTQALPQSGFSATTRSDSTTISLPVSFSTPSYSVSNTFTPITTYSTAGETKPTVITGTGANGTPYTFSYNVPVSTIGTVPVPGLDANLSSMGLPTTQQPLTAPTKDLQTNAALRRADLGFNKVLGGATAVLFGAIGAGAAVVLL
ncbi:hypothetical protein OC846_005503 [Tilletia horrida]|uniref:Uncharacterized protein n=1 Tax=Tilletia horrida TaxID=155126 RepID=A0AAN6JPV3_9BASI|nr:hypothetical protein OC846_005503 [Tilletia horrida]KAK0551549.1 hypothetical protein OC845_002129 [Tilletia horrida]KAK0569518.1 hypothetical protein OC861_000891 [Tilletia horrida]